MKYAGKEVNNLFKPTTIHFTFHLNVFVVDELIFHVVTFLHPWWILSNETNNGQRFCLNRVLNNQHWLWPTCVRPAETRHADHGGGPPGGGQAEPADCRTQRSSAGPGRGLHWRDGPLWPGENPRESRARQGCRWAALAVFCSVRGEFVLNAEENTITKSVWFVGLFVFFLLHSEFNPL